MDIQKKVQDLERLLALLETLRAEEDRLFHQIPPELREAIEAVRSQREMILRQVERQRKEIINGLKAADPPKDQIDAWNDSVQRVRVVVSERTTWDSKTLEALAEAFPNIKIARRKKKVFSVRISS